MFRLAERVVSVSDPAVTGVDVAGGDGNLGPGQRAERSEQCRLVLFDCEHEARATLVEVLGLGALDVERVGDDHHLCQVDTGVGEPVE